MNSKNKLINAYLIFIAISIIIVIAGLITNLGFCLFYNYTGIPCPSCGMTRAFKSLLYFDFLKAFWYHPLFPLVALFPYIYVKKSQRLIILVGFLFITVWILRIILLFPDVTPMVPNKSAIFYKIFIYLKGMIA